jgi:N-acetyl-anhydromuramyl-L-alanine amidase AmpD
MRPINEIYIHCSASEWGCAVVVDLWHRQLGWKQIGYHYVILNGFPHSKLNFIKILDGVIEPGTDSALPGVHVAGHNQDSIGICLIGDKAFTDLQLISAKGLVSDLRKTWGVDIANVKGHYEVPNVKKTCPNIPMDFFRKFLDDKISVQDLQKQIAIFKP